ncbi:MAG TPA: hypothetical protein VFV97_08750 [Rhodanobacteraceae bacterium]|nr:hypothetical protein [Rhodanobacteraceae bacterium]
MHGVQRRRRWRHDHFRDAEIAVLRRLAGVDGASEIERAADERGCVREVRVAAEIDRHGAVVSEVARQPAARVELHDDEVGLVAEAVTGPGEIDIAATVERDAVHTDDVGKERVQLLFSAVAEARDEAARDIELHHGSPAREKEMARGVARDRDGFVRSVDVDERRTSVAEARDDAA